MKVIGRRKMGSTNLASTIVTEEGGDLALIEVEVGVLDGDLDEVRNKT